MKTYIGILTVFLISLLLVSLMLILPKLIAPKKREPEKYIPYESGEIPIGEAWSRYPVRYYLVVLTFLIFEIEVLFILPWAIRVKELGFLGFIEIFIFVLILTLGWIWALKKKALKWD
ncbi:MAG: NADH-quinone oxidoreductase subunit A [Candidatus Hydrothermales bacterium]